MSDDELDGFRIVIPSKLTYFQLFFFSSWLSFWSLLEIYLFLRSICSPNKAISIVWLAFFTLVGSLAILDLSWRWIGREVILIDDSRLQLFWQLGKFGITKTYELAFVRNLRFDPDPRVRFPTQGRLGDMFRRMGIAGTTVAFDYGAKIHRFGQNISENEGRLLINTIRQRFEFPEERDFEIFPIPY